jgi:hypothetical protein
MNPSLKPTEVFRAAPEYQADPPRIGLAAASQALLMWSKNSTAQPFQRERQGIKRLQSGFVATDSVDEIKLHGFSLCALSCKSALFHAVLLNIPDHFEARATPSNAALCLCGFQKSAIIRRMCTCGYIYRGPFISSPRSRAHSS